MGIAMAARPLVVSARRRSWRVRAHVENPLIQIDHVPAQSADLGRPDAVLKIKPVDRPVFRGNVLQDQGLF